MNPISDGTASRISAARVLDAVLHRGRSLKGEFGTELPKIADPRDRALVEAICFAALRNRQVVRVGGCGQVLQAQGAALGVL